MTSNQWYPVWVISLRCSNLIISRMTIPGINFYLIPCLSTNLCCSSQMNLDILHSFLLSTLGVLECILPSKRKISGTISSMLQLPTLSRKLTRTTLTQGSTVWNCDPGILKGFLSLDDRLSMDHLMTLSIFVDRFEETFDLFGCYIRYLGNFSACFLLEKFFVGVVVIDLRGYENRKVFGATFGFVRTLLCATFHLFVLSLQIPMFQTGEKNGNIRIENVTGEETLTSPLYKIHPTPLYSHVHIVMNPIPISSNITETQRNDPNVFHSSGFVPLNSIVSAYWIVSSTSTTFLINSINGHASNTSNNGNVSSSSGNTPLPHLNFFEFLQKRNSKI